MLKVIIMSKWRMFLIPGKRLDHNGMYIHDSSNVENVLCDYNNFSFCRRLCGEVWLRSGQLVPRRFDVVNHGVTARGSNFLWRRERLNARP